jgi:hypothetical protein
MIPRNRLLLIVVGVVFVLVIAVGLLVLSQKPAPKLTRVFPASVKSDQQYLSGNSFVFFDKVNNLQQLNTDSHQVKLLATLASSEYARISPNLKNILFNLGSTTYAGRIVDIMSRISPYRQVIPGYGGQWQDNTTFWYLRQQQGDVVLTRTNIDTKKVEPFSKVDFGSIVAVQNGLVVGNKQGSEGSSDNKLVVVKAEQPNTVVQQYIYQQLHQNSSVFYNDASNQWYVLDSQFNPIKLPKEVTNEYVDGNPTEICFIKNPDKPVLIRYSLKNNTQISTLTLPDYITNITSLRCSGIYDIISTSDGIYEVNRSGK